MWNLPVLPRVHQPRRLVIVTSGGDSPGMNSAIRAIVRSAIHQGIGVLGSDRGYTGLVDDELRPMNTASVGNILHRGGTVLKSDRCDAFRQPDIRARVARQLRERQVDGLIVIGGDGSLTGAHLLATETGLPVVGLPGTIDNDISGTEDTIGFDTAVNTALEAIDRIRDTAHSHERVFLVEVMGRSSGFIALAVGLAGGAEAILLPDCRVDLPGLVRRLNLSKRRGKNSSLLVVAEGHDPRLTSRLAEQLSENGHQARACILGHIQRGGSPTGHDRLLASALGASAVDHLCAGHSDIMLGIQRGVITAVPLDEVAGRSKPLPTGILELAHILAN
ncbi:MAG: 6-phosphofructokinase [Ectothiorhodospiraceae bacterium]|nr:6-phosphofructokinase [Ectothiorhodospiraceae bacterium]